MPIYIAFLEGDHKHVFIAGSHVNVIKKIENSLRTDPELIDKNVKLKDFIIVEISAQTIQNS